MFATIELFDFLKKEKRVKVTREREVENELEFMDLNLLYGLNIGCSGLTTFLICSCWCGIIP